MRRKLSKIKEIKKAREIIKRNNQTSVTDADRKIPAPGSTESAGNSIIISFLALSVYPRIGISRPASETDDRFYFYYMYILISISISSK